MPFPPADKLPLATRKEFRDTFEAKKPEYDAQLSKIMGTAWIIIVDPKVIFPYIDRNDLQARVGASLDWYFEPFMRNLVEFIKKYGDDGKAELNSLAPSHALEIHPQTTTKYTYGGIAFEEEKMRIVFAEGCYAVNASSIADVDKILEAVKGAEPAAGGSKGLSIEIRNSIDAKYNPKIGAVQDAIAKQVGLDTIALNPNFEVNAAAIAKSGEGSRNWEVQFPLATLQYFQSVQKHLEANKFGNDDMLQEAFQEEVSKNEVTLKVVEKLQKGTYHEVLLEDGKLVIAVTPKNWWVNVGDTAEKIMDLF